MAFAALTLLAACAHHGGVERLVRPGTTERGRASWYGEPFHGRRTASGEVFDMHDLTAAHRSLPFGTKVRVTRRDTGDRVDVRVNDRGPFVRGRIIDLSYGAARRIGLDVDGVAPVTLEVVGRDQKPRTDRDPAPVVAEDGCLWVQVGAFGEEANAQRARARLVDGGETAVVSEGPGGLHRVRVGPFTSRSAADAAVHRLRAEWPPARVVSCGG